MIPVIEANAQKIYPSINILEEFIVPPQSNKKYMLIKITYL